MLEFAILGLLKERAMHGYDLRKHLRDDFGVLANLSFGSLYPALGRLEASGAIRVLPNTQAVTAVDESPILLTGSLGGERAATVARRATAKVAETLGRSSTRARKVYEITPAGEELFERLLESPAANENDPRGFSIRLAFARHLSPSARIRLLERRHMELVDRLQRSSNNLERPSRLLDVYERSLAEHARDAVASDISWIERLLAQERSALVESTSQHNIHDGSRNAFVENNQRAVNDASFAHDGGSNT